MFAYQKLGCMDVLAVNKNSDNYRYLLLITILIFLFTFVYPVNKVCSQSYSWSDFVEYVHTEMNDEMQETETEEWLEELMNMHEHPVNINVASKEELAGIPFLTDSQIEDIQAYIYRYGPMKMMHELLLVPSVGYWERMFLPLFLYASSDIPVEKKSFKLKNLFEYGENELITKLDIPLYQRDGYKDYDRETLLKSPNKKYLGNPLYHNIRYGYRYGDKLSAGFTAEKDPGEPFGSYGNRSYDMFSFHALLKTDGRLKSLALGDYKLHFGQGLVLGTGSMSGKSLHASVSASGQGIKRFFSTSEMPHFRGAAATVRLNKTEVTLFVSQNRNDATLNTDGTVATWRKDGYHRTLSEMDRKHNLTSRTAGGNILWNASQGYAGLVGYYQHFNRSFVPGADFYRMYYPSGKEFGVLGAYYGFHRYRFSASGEAGYSFNRRGWAALNTFAYRFNSRYRLKLLHRYYSHRYSSFYSGAFSENTSVTDENGIYAGVEASPLDYLQVEAYADVFYFKWPRYGLSHSSGGYDGLLRIRSRCSANVSALFSYRVKKKEKFDIYRTYHQLKARIEYTPFNNLVLKYTVAYNHTRSSAVAPGDGILISQQAGYRFSSDRLRLSLYAAYFRCNDYESRLYDYEPTLLYTFAFPSYNGEGIRLSLTGRWTFCSRWTLLGKYGLTGYFDRNSIGTGPQRIARSSKNDISVQLRYVF